MHRYCYFLALLGPYLPFRVEWLPEKKAKFRPCRLFEFRHRLHEDPVPGPLSPRSQYHSTSSLRKGYLKRYFSTVQDAQSMSKSPEDPNDSFFATGSLSLSIDEMVAKDAIRRCSLCHKLLPPTFIPCTLSAKTAKGHRIRH
jgi:hypothetical protein